MILIWLLYQDPSSNGQSNPNLDYQELPRDSFDEQQDHPQGSSPSEESVQEHIQRGQRDDQNRSSSPWNNDERPSNQSLSMVCNSWWRQAHTLLSRLFSSRIAAFCLAGFLFKRIAFTSEGFIFQYTSEKFGWRLRDTTWLRITAGVGAVVTTMMICPLLTVFCKRKNYDTHKLDLWIVRVCLIVLCVSFMTAFKASKAAWLFPGSNPPYASMGYADESVFSSFRHGSWRRNGASSTRTHNVHHRALRLLPVIWDYRYGGQYRRTRWRPIVCFTNADRKVQAQCV